MYFKSPSSRVSFGAAIEVADERLLPSMSQLVCLKMPFRDELLGALVTNKGSLSCMSPHMSFEISSFRKLLETPLKRTYEDLLFIFGTFDLLDGCYMKLLSLDTRIPDERLTP